jgi:UDP-GlcNAc:undecaprenyl-phosphate GlcNAc-1-phosphate transferase
MNILAIGAHPDDIEFGCGGTLLKYSCLGFLPHNLRYKNPAVIFLGDAGSTFMGFMLAGMVLMGGWGGEDPIKAYAMPMLIMGIFIFDMVYTTISRIASKKVVSFNGWLEHTGKDHLHHRLTSLGLSALVLRNGTILDALLLLLQAVTIYLIIVILMIRVKLRDRRREDRVEEEKQV